MDWLDEEEKKPLGPEQYAAVANSVVPKDYKSYMAQKQAESGLGDDKRQAIEKEVEDAAPAHWRRALYAAGGGNPNDLYGGQESARKKLSDFDKKRAGISDDLNNQRTFAKMQRDDADYDADNNPNSEQSKMAQMMAASFTNKKPEDFAGKSAAQLNKALPFMREKYNVDQGRIRRGDELRDKAEAKAEAARLKKEEDDKKSRDEREVGGVGIARTKDDAKKLKDSVEIKTSFDRNLQEMIDLREKHGGGATMNREDVKRGKQLATDLAFQYKELVKLGVLSATDTGMLNKVIPEDPLAYDWEIGQDSIMANMKKFQSDRKDDYETKLKTRLSERFESFPKRVTNSKTGETAEVNNAEELAEATKEGFQ